jgi:hypothetical protein
MSPGLQTFAALLIAAAAAVWLVLRSLAKRRNPGCGGDCGCPSGDLRTRARDQEKALRTHG